VKNIVTKRFNFNLSLPLFIICILFLFIAFVAVFRISDLHPYSVPKQLDIKTEKEILLKIGDDGETLILDDEGNVLVSYSKEQENFVSTVTKVLERDRKKVGIFENSNVFLRLSNKDRISIFDPQTEREIDLAGFGDDNIQIFFNLLE
jgi:putative photosynthetic complex assembly protein